MNKLSEKELKNFIKDKFNVSKYNKCGAFSAGDWAEALSFRYATYQVIEQFDEKARFNTAIALLSHSKRIIGIFDQEAPSPYVTDLNLIDLVEAYDQCQKIKGFNESVELFNNEIRNIETFTIPKLLLEPFNKHRNRPKTDLFLLSVDLSATDGQLKIEFEQWLLQTRSKNNENESTKWTTKTFTQTDFEKWCRLNILGFIDLKIIEKGLNISFSNFELGNLLFPISEDNEVDISERVRKVVAPLTAKIFTSETIGQLQAASRL